IENSWEDTLRELHNDKFRHDRLSFLCKEYLEEQISSIKRIVKYGVTNVFYKKMKDNYNNRLSGTQHDFGAVRFFLNLPYQYEEAKATMHEYFYRDIEAEMNPRKAEDFKPEIIIQGLEQPTEYALETEYVNNL